METVLVSSFVVPSGLKPLYWSVLLIPIHCLEERNTRRFCLSYKSEGKTQRGFDKSDNDVHLFFSVYIHVCCTTFLRLQNDSKSLKRSPALIPRMDHNVGQIHNICWKIYCKYIFLMKKAFHSLSTIYNAFSISMTYFSEYIFYISYK